MFLHEKACLLSFRTKQKGRRSVPCQSSQLEIILLVLLILIVVLAVVLTVILVVVLITVCTVVILVLVFIILIVVRHMKLLLLIFSYTGIMSETHRKYSRFL